MTEEWLDHIDLPDGQWANLLKRYPYERAQMIEIGRERDMALTQSLLEQGRTKASAQRMTITGFMDVVLRASLWEAKLTHDLTGEEIGPEQVGMADPRIVNVLSEKAMENYIAWYDEAYAGPKETSRTANRTRSGKKAAEPLGTSEPE